MNNKNKTIISLIAVLLVLIIGYLLTSLLFSTRPHVPDDIVPVDPTLPTWPHDPTSTTTDPDPIDTVIIKGGLNVTAIKESFEDFGDDTYGKELHTETNEQVYGMSFYGLDSSLRIIISAEPYVESRALMEQDLLQSTGQTKEELCDANIWVGVLGDEGLLYDDIGLTFCDGSFAI